MLELEEKINKATKECSNKLKKMEKILRSPTFETKITKAVFLEQDIVVYDCVNNHSCVRITGANYVLDNVKTLNAEWTYREVAK